MKKSMILTLSANELLTAVGTYLINEGIIKHGDFDRIILGHEVVRSDGKGWTFEVFKDSDAGALPPPESKVTPVEHEHLKRMLRPEGEEL